MFGIESLVQECLLQLAHLQQLPSSLCLVPSQHAHLLILLLYSKLLLLHTARHVRRAGNFGHCPGSARIIKGLNLSSPTFLTAHVLRGSCGRPPGNLIC